MNALCTFISGVWGYAWPILYALSKDLDLHVLGCGSSTVAVQLMLMVAVEGRSLVLTGALLVLTQLGCKCEGASKCARVDLQLIIPE